MEGVRPDTATVFAPVELTATEPAAANPVPAMIWSSVGGVLLVLMATNNVPLASLVVAPAVAVAEPVFTPVGDDRTGAVVSAPAAVVKADDVATSDWLPAASSCMYCQ